MRFYINTPVTDPFVDNGIEFVSSSTNDHDVGLQASMPEGFGDVEFTLEVIIEPDDTQPIGQSSSGAGRRDNWANETAEPGDSSTWWWLGNFLLDGHNNGGSNSGSFDLQIYNSGQVRWLFGDGDAGVPNGGLWGIQNSSGINVLDGNRHVIACIRRWQSSPANSADLELWVDGVLQDTVNTGSRTNMATSYWDGPFAAFSVEEQAWFWGAEKQSINVTDFDYADYKGQIKSIAFFNGAKDSQDLQGINDAVDVGHTDYADHYAFDEGTGDPVSEVDGIVMDMTNPQAGGFWP